MKQLLHTAEGMRDVYGEECEKKIYLMNRIDELFSVYGFQFIQPPVLEYLEVFTKDEGHAASSDYYKLFDRDGRTLVLRPDFTPSIARALAMYFMNENLPMRFCYEGSVFLNTTNYHGILNESTEMGVELINDESFESEAEVIALACEIMKAAGIEDFRLTIGNVAIFHALTAQYEIGEEDVEKLKELLIMRNRFGAQEFIGSLDLPEEAKKIFCELPSMFGKVEVLDRAEALITANDGILAIQRLRKVYEYLKYYHCEKYVAFDLSLLSRYSYYTGIIFNVLTYGSGDAVIKGGRYDEFVEKFGKKAQAVGFTTQIDAILSAQMRQGIKKELPVCKIVLLYLPSAKVKVIQYAQALRSKGYMTAQIPKDENYRVEDYLLHAIRHNYQKLVLIDEQRAVLFDLLEDSSSELDIDNLNEGVLK